MWAPYNLELSLQPAEAAAQLKRGRYPANDGDDV